MAKRAFGPTFNEVKNNIDNTERKTLSLRKRGKVIIIHKKCIIYKKPTCKNLKIYYYTFFKIAPKGKCDGPWPGLYYSRPLAGTHSIGLMV